MRSRLKHLSIRTKARSRDHIIHHNPRQLTDWYEEPNIVGTKGWDVLSNSLHPGTYLDHPPNPVNVTMRSGPLQ